MFSQEERTVYKNNQLVEVVCQLRFPTILAIAENAPAEFQDAIRKTFPQYKSRLEAIPPKMIQVPGQPPKMEPQKPVMNHQFVSADGAYRVNMTQNFISLACIHYCCWEDFAGLMDKVLASFIKIYEPAGFDRVGLRYVNAFSKKSLDMEDCGWKEMLQPAYLGLLSDEELPERAFTRCSQDVECAIPGGCRAKIHVGPGMLRRGTETDKEVKLILDIDVSMSGSVPVNLAAGAMQTIHTQCGSIFRAAITDTLHDALEPDV